MRYRSLVALCAMFCWSFLLHGGEPESGRRPKDSSDEASVVEYPREVTRETLADKKELARLEKSGVVFFSEDFENTDLNGWFNRHGVKDGRNRVVLDKTLAHTGEGALQLDTVDRGGKESDASGSYWFQPGHDTVYFRRYIKFADDYDQGRLNHVGGSMYAVAGDNKWGGMGKAGMKPDGDDRFGAGFEPWRGKHEAPGYMMLYTYWMDMKKSGDGKYWGNNLTPSDEQKVVLKRGEWICLEHMIRANTPGKADGEMAAWIDGKLYMHWKGFRWRSTDEVKIKRISLTMYVHQSRKNNTVWYDDVALSTGYVGPTRE